MTFVQFEANAYCGVLGGQTSPSFVWGIWCHPAVFETLPVVEGAARTVAEYSADEAVPTPDVEPGLISVAFLST
jgi:hypothetical protein